MRLVVMLLALCLGCFACDAEVETDPFGPAPSGAGASDAGARRGDGGRSSSSGGGPSPGSGVTSASGSGSGSGSGYGSGSSSGTSSSASGSSGGNAGSSGGDDAAGPAGHDGDVPPFADGGGPAVDAGPPGACLDTPPPLAACDDGGHARVVPVATAADLKAALAAAKAGDLIRLAAATFAGEFVGAASGTDAEPIVLCGSRASILQGPGLNGYTFHLTGSHWVLSGFQVKGGQKGIVLDGASYDLLDNLEVSQIGDEGVHFRMSSTHDTLQYSKVHDTGIGSDPHSGEGVYVGSSINTASDDFSDYDVVFNNWLGPNTSAENLDVKENTQNGVVQCNHFDGTGQNASVGTKSIFDVKGVNYLIADNRGLNSKGFDAAVEIFDISNLPLSGKNNVFRRNVFDVNGGRYGFDLGSSVMNGGGNVVGCDNVITNATMGVSDLTPPCVP